MSLLYLLSLLLLLPLLLLRPSADIADPLLPTSAEEAATIWLAEKMRKLRYTMAGGSLPEESLACGSVVEKSAFARSAPVQST